MFGLGDPKGEVRVCPVCQRVHDILRRTGVLCACGTFVRSKEYSVAFFKKKLQEEKWELTKP
jgi:hypothetical protein